MNQPTVREAFAEYVPVLQRLVGDFDFDAVLRVRAYLLAARELGRTIFITGSGGSATTASQWATDLATATRQPEVRPIRVMCLNDHGAWLAAPASDGGGKHEVSVQLDAFVEPGDVLVVFAATRHSPDLIEAVCTARGRGAMTIAFLGFDAGALRERVHDSIWLPAPKGPYEPTEDAFLIIGDLLTASLAASVAEGADTDDACAVRSAASRK